MVHHASVASPLGARLIGSGVGQFLECPTPSGSKKLRVEAVCYQPEAARRLRDDFAARSNAALGAMTRVGATLR